MTDRRRFWAEASEAGIAEAARLHGLRLVEPTVQRTTLPVCDLCSMPHGARERQLLRGQALVIRAVDDKSGWAYGETQADRYSGWIDSAAILGHPAGAPTHRVAAAQSYAKTSSGLKSAGDVTPLSMGSALVVLDEADGWSRIAWTAGNQARDLFVPSVHLMPIGRNEDDPVAVAERLVGTPYLWGGNSAFGIDCSGLVQIACHACGIDCPGDSDMQEAHFPAAPGDSYQRGDLLFWRGHVAWVADPQTLVHANAHHMAVAHEPIAAAIARIAAQGDGPVTCHARPTA